MFHLVETVWATCVDQLCLNLNFLRIEHIRVFKNKKS